MSFLTNLINQLYGTENSETPVTTNSESISPESTSYTQIFSNRTLEKLKGFHRLSKDCISKGIEADEKGRKNEALSYYEKSLDIINEGLNVQFHGRFVLLLSSWQRELKTLEKLNNLHSTFFLKRNRRGPQNNERIEKVERFCLREISESHFSNS